RTGITKRRKEETNISSIPGSATGTGDCEGHQGLSTSEERPKAGRQPVLIIQNSVRWHLCTLELPRLLAQSAAGPVPHCRLLSKMESLVNQIAFSAGSATSDTPGGADEQEEMTLHWGVQVVSRCKSVLIQLLRMLGGRGTPLLARDPKGSYRATQVDSPWAEPPFTVSTMQVTLCTFGDQFKEEVAQMQTTWKKKLQPTSTEASPSNRSSMLLQQAITTPSPCKASKEITTSHNYTQSLQSLKRKLNTMNLSRRTNDLDSQKVDVETVVSCMIEIHQTPKGRN
ncbi:hypothetical protein VP01_5831g1, partial [Puccinia sorghi]